MSVICLNDDEIVHKKGMSIAIDPMMRTKCRPIALTPPSRSLRIDGCVVRRSMVVCMFDSAPAWSIAVGMTAAPQPHGARLVAFSHAGQKPGRHDRHLYLPV